jgi:heterodisulfide reductase subunit A
MKRYLVIGSGVTGGTAAGELARQGHRVFILESTGRIGGKVLSYCCKATDSCSRCGVCVAHARIADALRHPRISVMTGARIEKVENGGGTTVVSGFFSNPGIAHRICTDCKACMEVCPAGSISRYSRGGLTFIAIDFASCLLHNGKKCSACADACPAGAIRTASGPKRRFTVAADGVLIATGHETFNPIVKARLGYGRLPGVMTGMEAEQTLSRQDWLPAPVNGGGGDSAGVPARSVAFIQCVGSRDPRLKRNFCSSVCCAYALRMSRMLKARNPDMDITVYYIDIQNFDKVFTPFRAELDRMGIRFVRGIPSAVARTGGQRLSLLIEDPEGKRATAEHDVVVLSTGVAPAEGAAGMASLFGLELDEFGFLRSGLAGVRVAGTCGEPQGIIDSIASARAAALELVK